MAAAAMAMALVQTIPVAAKATGDVEVPGLSQQILAGSQMHSVWMDVEPLRPRTNGTSWCSAGDRGADRSSGHRDGGAEGQTAETGGCGAGLGPGSAGQGEEEPRSRGGVTTIQQKMEEARADQTAGGSGHCDLRRCGGAGASDAHASPATNPRSGFTRGSGENDRCLDQQKTNATSATASVSADDADGHAGNSLSKNCRSRRKLCCAKPCDKRRTLQLDTARKARGRQEGRKRLTAEELRVGLENDLGEKWSEIDDELRSRFVQAVNDRFAPC